METIWALDIDDGGWPDVCHKIVRTEADEEDGEVRITACGSRLTRFNHPRGWRKTERDEPPLQDPYMHCGA